MHSIHKSEVFIVLPAFNEATVIEGIIREIHKSGFTKIVVVDDGSIDETVQVAKKAGAVVISHAVNRGQGAAIQTGIEYVRKTGGSYLVMMDSDGQFFAHDIDSLIKQYEHTGADIILGSRFLQKNKIPFRKRIFNGIANLVTYCISGFWLTDSQTGFRMLGPRAVAQLEVIVDGYEFCSDMIRIARTAPFTISEAPITVRYYEYANKKGQSFGTGIETFFRLLTESLFR